MKVLYHHRTQGEIPESIHIDGIVQALKNRGHEVVVVGPVPLTTGAKKPKRSWLGAVKERLPRPLVELGQLAYNRVASRKLDEAIRSFQPDLIYERYALFNYAALRASRKWRLPLVLEVNTPYAHVWQRYYRIRLSRLAKRIELDVLQRADRVITVTASQQKFLVELGIPEAKIAVSHNAIDPAHFNLAPEVPPQLRQRLGLRDLVIGFVGTMNRWQSIPQFASVIEQVVAQRPDASFLFVGDGEFRRPLEDLLKQKGLEAPAVFVGRQPHTEVPAFIGAMDIAVLLDSNTYGSPMKLFEYWGMGRPVIAPQVPPIEELQQRVQAMLLIEPGNVEQMAGAILTLGADPALRRQLGDAGKQYVLEHHTWDHNAEQIEQLARAVEASAPGRA
jgi:glycosyltransferase involved in cell wall biosynthesis